MATDQVQVERRVGQRFEYHLPVVFVSSDRGWMSLAAPKI